MSTNGFVLILYFESVPCRALAQTGNKFIKQFKLSVIIENTDHLRHSSLLCWHPLR